MKVRKNKLVENINLVEADSKDDFDDIDIDDIDLSGVEFDDDEDQSASVQKPADQPKEVKSAPEKKVEPAKPEPKQEPKVEPKAAPAAPKEEPVEDKVNDPKTVDVKPSGDVVGTVETPVAKPKKIAQVIDLKNLLDLKKVDLPKNALFSALRASLAQARVENLTQRVKKLPEKNFSEKFNILVEGLPGSGKTAVIKSWAQANEVNLVAVNAKDPDLELAINGAIMRDLNTSDDSKGNKNSIVKAYSKLLAPLEKPDSILFLDEYNRQTDDQIRASLLTLIGEHCIYGEVEGAESKDDKKENYHFFKNMLFTVAAINPAHSTDKGAAHLNDAEKSRFLKHLEFNSNTKDAMSYFKWHFDKELARIVEQNKDPYSADPAYAWVYATTFAQKHLVLFLLMHPKFKFDTKDDLDSLYIEDKTMLNQRLLAQIINSLLYHPEISMADQLLTYIGKKTGGNVYDLLDLEPGEQNGQALSDASNLLEKDKKMIEDILKDYTSPHIDVPGYGDITQIGNEMDDFDAEDAIDDYDSDINDANMSIDDLGEDEEDGDLFANDALGGIGMTDSAELNDILGSMDKNVDKILNN